MNKRQGSNSSATMRITRRVVNSKRHTKGYMINGKFHSVAQTKKLAASGRIYGVRVVGEHVQSEGNGRRRLSELPFDIRN